MSVADLKAPTLVTPKEICELIPSIKLRTLRYWIQNAAPREVWHEGKKFSLPGNGLGRAVIRKGNVTLVDWEMFIAWLDQGRMGESPNQAES